MIVEIILLSCILAFLFLYSKYSANQKLLEELNGPRGIPLLGNALEFTGGNIFQRAVPRLAELIRKHGERTKFFLGWIPNALLVSAEDVEKILGSSANIQKADLYRFIVEWVGYSLITANGDKWHFKRKLLTPTFHHKILEDFVPVMDEQAQNLISKLKLKLKARKGPIHIEKEITLANLDIICETAMGRKAMALDNSDSPYVRAVNEVSKLIIIRIFKPWLIPDFLWKISRPGKDMTKCVKTMHNFTKQVIKEKVAERSLKNIEAKSDTIKGTKGKVAFLDLLLKIQEENPGNISNEEMLYDVETFLLAGTDTASTALKWTILLLGNHPDVQRRVHEELDGIFGHDTNRPVTMADVKRMQYLELVIKESHRLYPPVPVIMREITTPLVFDDRVVLKAGVTAWISIHHLHHNPKYWDSPEIFNPERFTTENSRGRHPYAYIPFSAGSRNCIGQKFAMIVEKIILANLLRQFHVKSALRMNEITPTWEIMWLPVEGVEVTLTSRKLHSNLKEPSLN